MKITFLCDFCRSELTVAAHFAGRTILCPRCRQKTRIPESNASAPDLATSADASETSVSGVKFCADFVPNPFAFSVRLDVFAASNEEEDALASNAETPVSKTPCVDELIATLLEEENR